MSDIMLQGVLRMPYEMAMENEWSRRQFHDRAQQAAYRIEELESVVRELLSYVESEYIGSRGKDYSNGAIGRARAALGE